MANGPQSTLVQSGTTQGGSGGGGGMFDIAGAATAGASIGNIIRQNKRAEKAQEKLEFRVDNLPNLAELTERAVNVFRDKQQGFLQSQLAAQRSQFGDFFDLQANTISQGRSLIDQLTEGDLARRGATERIRSAQAARGLSLSPAAAIQEGLAVSEAQQQSQLNALGLGQQLAGFSAQTPLNLQQLDIGQLLQAAQSTAFAKVGMQTQIGQAGINLGQQNAAQMAALGGRLSSGFAGAGQAGEGNRLSGFNQGFGISGTQQRQQFPQLTQSNVSTTAGVGVVDANARSGEQASFNMSQKEAIESGQVL